MKIRVLLFFLLFIVSSCKRETKQVLHSKNNPKTENISTSDFELVKSKAQEGLLILFPCLPCDAKNTFTEFNIEQISIENRFSVLAMNYNQRLFLTELEKQKLSIQLEKIVETYNLPTQNVFIGGFSSGGNISLLISDYLVKNDSKIKLEGVFAVDAPIDLLALYKTAQKNIEMNFSEASVQEASWVKKEFDKSLGDPKNGIENYESYSPFTLETQQINNLKHLNHLKIRLYTEPDLAWWKENRNNDYQDLNAYYLKQLAETLTTEFGHKNIELIETENRGYRANGERHPHSWSIVNEKEFLKWM